MTPSNRNIPRFWPFVRGIHRSLVISPHNDQWRGALISSLISAWKNGWVNDREAGDPRHHRAHYDVIVMKCARIWHLENKAYWNSILVLSVYYTDSTKIIFQHFISVSHQIGEIYLWFFNATILALRNQLEYKYSIGCFHYCLNDIIGCSVVIPIIIYLAFIFFNSKVRKFPVGKPDSYTYS